MVRLAPKDAKFLDMFSEMAGCLSDGAQLLRDVLTDFENVEVRAQQLREFERRGDQITHATLLKLAQSSTTPFDREEIRSLALAFDGALNAVGAAGQRLMIYKISHVPPAALELAEIISRQARHLQKGVAALENRDTLPEICSEVYKLEGEAEHVARTALTALFDRERDPIALIKLKELLELLQSGAKQANAAAFVLETVALKTA